MADFLRCRICDQEFVLPFAMDWPWDEQPAGPCCSELVDLGFEVAMARWMADDEG